jgi:hypothetical protein
MGSNKCSECNEAVPVWACTCSHCGAPNSALRVVMTVAAGLVVLIVAGIGGIYLSKRPPHPVAGEGLVGASTANADGDFAWLVSAMAACDKLASQQPAKLHFLVIPLSADQKDMPDWRLIAVAPIGNAMTLLADDALGGLRRGTLRIYADEYVFSVRDAGGSVVYKWSPSVGVKQFSTDNTATISSVRMQLQPRHKADQTDWGKIFSNQNGNCNWVPAIVRD